MMLATIAILLLFLSFAKAQDNIIVWGESSNNALKVNTTYYFRLNSSDVGAEIVNWSVQRNGEDFTKFSNISGSGKEVSFNFNESLLSNAEGKDFTVIATNGNTNKTTHLNIQLKKTLTTDSFVVTSDNGVLIQNNNLAQIIIEPGESIKILAHIPEIEGSISEMTTWSLGTPSTYFGYAVLISENEITYTAISQINPTLTTGVDTIVVSNGEKIVTITIIIQHIHHPFCDTSKPLSVVPGNNEVVQISRLTQFTLTALGGTCNYTWRLLEVNSTGASLTRINQYSALYFSGSKENTTDIIELTDGLSIKLIEVKNVSSKPDSSGSGCFLRNKKPQRD